MEISPKWIKFILDSYLAVNWWAKVQRQLLCNKNLSFDKAILFFVFGLV